MFYKQLGYMTKVFYDFWKVISLYTLKHIFWTILSLFSPSGNIVKCTLDCFIVSLWVSDALLIHYSFISLCFCLGHFYWFDWILLIISPGMFSVLILAYPKTYLFLYCVSYIKHFNFSLFCNSHLYVFFMHVIHCYY